MRIQSFNIFIQERKIAELNVKLDKGFAVADGPFVRGVEAVLQSLNVQRQQYHGGAFVGNHVHKLLEVRNK